MENILLELRKAFATRISPSSGTNSVKDIIGTKLAYYQSDERWKIPFIVFYFLSIPQTRDSVSKFYDVQISFLIVESTLQKNETLTQNLLNLLEDSEAYLSFESFHVIEITRAPLIAPALIENVWNSTTQYKLKLQTK